MAHTAVFDVGNSTTSDEAHPGALPLWAVHRFSPACRYRLGLTGKPPLTVPLIDDRLIIILAAGEMIDLFPCVVADIPFDTAVTGISLILWRRRGGLCGGNRSRRLTTSNLNPDDGSETLRIFAKLPAFFVIARCAGRRHRHRDVDAFSRRCSRNRHNNIGAHPMSRNKRASYRRARHRIRYSSIAKFW